MITASNNPFINPVYKTFFPKEEIQSKEKNWEDFNSKVEDCIGPISAKGREVDFSIDTCTWKSSALKIGNGILNLTIFALGIYGLKVKNENSKLLFRAAILVGVLKFGAYALQRITMWAIFPLSIPLNFHEAVGYQDDVRREYMPIGKEIIFRHVILEKDGTRYSGLLIGKKATIENGKWCLQATGNMEPIESSMPLFQSCYSQHNYNLLMISGPSAGRSEGTAMPQTLGDAQEVGLRYLEEAIRAKRIVMAGRSLGGVASGLAALQHEFKKDVNYLAIRQMAFDRISNEAAKMIGFNPLRWLIKGIGCEMDAVAASKKLQEQGIHEVVIQCTKKGIEKPTTENDFKTDGPIKEESCLARCLIEEKMTDNKTFIGLPEAWHMTPDAISVSANEIKKWDRQLDEPMTLIATSNLP